MSIPISLPFVGEVSEQLRIGERESARVRMQSHASAQKREDIHVLGECVVTSKKSPQDKLK